MAYRLVRTLVYKRGVGIRETDYMIIFKILDISIGYWLSTQIIINIVPHPARS